MTGITRAILTPEGFSRSVYLWVPASLGGSASVFTVKNPASTPQQPCDIRFRTGGTIDMHVQDDSVPDTAAVQWNSYVGKFARVDMQYQWDPDTHLSRCWVYVYFDYHFEDYQPTTSMYGEFTADEPVNLSSTGLSFELERGWWSLVFPPPFNYTAPLVGLWPGSGGWAGDVRQTTCEISYYAESYVSGGTTVPIVGTDVIGMKTATNVGMSTGVVAYTGGVRNAAAWRRFQAVGLTAGTTYFHQMTVNGTLVGQVSKFKTLKAVGATPCTTKLAVYGCKQDNPASAAVPADMATFAPDRAVMLGDKGYPDTLTASVTDFTHEANWALQVTDPATQAVMALCSEDYTISDHDVNGGTTPEGNAPNFNDPTSAQNLVEWADIVPALMADVRTPKRGRYRSYIEGKVRYIHLDTRSQDRTDVRFGIPPDSPSSTMLGATQLLWLKAEVDAASLAGQFCCIFTDPSWNGLIANPPNTEGPGGTYDKNGTDAGYDGTDIAVSYSDKWPAYKFERDLISDYIKASYLAHGKGANAAIFASDSHALQQDDGTHEKNGIATYVCGPFHQNVHAHFLNRVQRTYPANADSQGRLPSKQMYQQVTLAETGGVLTLTVVGRNCTAKDGGPVTPSGFDPTPRTYTL